MITARLFAQLREQAGTDLEVVDLAGATVEDAYRVLFPAG
jgi:molybdopterin converting factor small subunit